MIKAQLKLILPEKIGVYLTNPIDFASSEKNFLAV